MDSGFPDRTESSSGRPDFGSQLDFLDVTIGRPLANVSTQPVETINSGLFYTVEMAMKKYADDILQSLEGISGCLSQLELHCYSLEQSLGEIQADLVREHGEADKKLRSLENHLQEVDSSIQILIDNQELVNTQKELARLHLVKKQYAAISCSQHNGGIAASTFEPKTCVTLPDNPKQQLTLALPSQAMLPIATKQQYLPYRELPIQQAAPSSQPTQQMICAQVQPNIYQPLQNQALKQTPQNQYLHAELQHAHQMTQYRTCPGRHHNHPGTM